jgi:hypothetical protein
MWTAKNRGRYDSSKLRYPSDLTDDEWAHVAPLIPPARRGGNKRTVDVREVMNGIMYVLSTREASPTAAIIDSQSVKCAEKGGRTIRMATTQERRSKARSAIFS